uniref:Uncharacterized protein n=1 Tax=Arundo donax TaxID=35708 RepID=A0A0A9BR88_ARUDO
MQSMAFRHSFLYVNAMEVVHKGNKDVGAWNIVAKDLKKTQKKLDAYYKAQEQANAAGANQWKRSKSHFTAPNGYYTTNSDVGGDRETDVKLVQGNSYGASGSSAGMSDSELLAIIAPSFRRPTGRPRSSQFKGHLDGIKKRIIAKKLSGSRLGKKSTVNDLSTEGQKKKIRCGQCHLLGHSTPSCRKKKVDLDTELPEF